jgi:2-iminobutanoate/2-iminopropanoate deaminase
MARHIVFTRRAAKPPANIQLGTQGCRFGTRLRHSAACPEIGIKGTAIQEPTRQCLVNIVAILEEAGSSVDKIVTATIVLAD